MLQIVRVLRKSGAEVVLAGGCVRDALLGLKPKDLDLATSALPDQVEALFPRTLNVGKAFGTIVVVENGINFEVTTFRSDGPYLDGRHPSKVEFTGMRQDAARRDFTMNALFYDPLSETIFDFVEGIQDLREGRLKTVGVALERFTEDRLRMLRAVRFNAQLGFELDGEVIEAIRSERQFIGQVAQERIFNEMKKFLEGRYLIRGFETLLSTDLFENVWPEIKGLDPERLQAFGAFSSWENAYATVSFLLQIKDPAGRLKEWKAPRESVRRVIETLKAVNILLNPESRVCDRVQALGVEWSADVVTMACGALAPDQSRLNGWVQEFMNVAGPDGNLPEPLINGQDLIERGIPPGAEMGRLLKVAFEAQLEGRVRKKDEALAFIFSN